MFHATVLLAALGYLGMLCMFTTLHFLNRSYSVLGHAVSDYGVGASARWFKVYGVLGTLAALLLAVWLLLHGAPHA